MVPVDECIQGALPDTVLIPYFECSKFSILNHLAHCLRMNTQHPGNIRNGINLLINHSECAFQARPPFPSYDVQC